MKLSILQLNINADNYWDSLINFFSQNDFDVIQLQEVTGKNTKLGNTDSKRDCFEDLKKILAEKYSGHLVVTERFAQNQTSYLGNATFYKKEYSLIEKNEIFLHKNKEPFPSDSTRFEEIGRGMLHLTLNIDGKVLSLINTHGAWGGTTDEKPFQEKQLKIATRYLKSIKKPFVFTGDLNISPDQPSILELGKLAQNLVTEHQIANTLNPRTHSAKSLFPPGAAVDYIFTSTDIKVADFQVLTDEDISDHLGLIVKIEV